MTINTDDLLKSILESIERIDYIKAEDIPNIDLYMDQVTTFMENKLKKSVRNQAEDKVLTKTMINNYAKNNLLPPPIKKKYTKEHILLLIFIYYYKGILSISDIQMLLKPLTEKFFQTKEDFTLESVYEGVFALEKEQIENLKQDLIQKADLSQNVFENAPEDKKEFLQLFSFISLLSFDVYVKKLLVEKLVDGFLSEEDHSKPKESNEKKKKE